MSKQQKSKALQVLTTELFHQDKGRVRRKLRLSSRQRCFAGALGCNGLPAHASASHSTFEVTAEFNSVPMAAVGQVELVKLSLVDAEHGLASCSILCFGVDLLSRLRG
jgi:hypothetical protein